VTSPTSISAPAARRTSTATRGSSPSSTSSRDSSESRGRVGARWEPKAERLKAERAGADSHFSLPAFQTFSLVLPLRIPQVGDERRRPPFLPVPADRGEKFFALR